MERKKRLPKKYLLHAPCWCSGRICLYCQIYISHADSRMTRIYCLSKTQDLMIFMILFSFSRNFYKIRNLEANECLASNRSKWTPDKYEPCISWYLTCKLCICIYDRRKMKTFQRMGIGKSFIYSWCPHRNQPLAYQKSRRISTLEYNFGG